MTLFLRCTYDVPAHLSEIYRMYILIYKCTDPYRSFFAIFCENRQISFLVCPLVPSIYYKFPHLTAFLPLYIFTCPFFAIWRNPLCSFEKLFRNNSGFFVYLLQNPSVRNFCEVGHENPKFLSLNIHDAAWYN